MTRTFIPENTRLRAPYTFQDNTDYKQEKILANSAEVIHFFVRGGLVDKSHWGNAYVAGMEDANGTGCWVVAGPRGGLRVIAYEQWS